MLYHIDIILFNKFVVLIFQIVWQGMYFTKNEVNCGCLIERSKGTIVYFWVVGSNDYSQEYDLY